MVFFFYRFVIPKKFDRSIFFQTTDSYSQHCVLCHFLDLELYVACCIPRERLVDEKGCIFLKFGFQDQGLSQLLACCEIWIETNEISVHRFQLFDPFRVITVIWFDLVRIEFCPQVLPYYILLV